MTENPIQVPGWYRLGLRPSRHCANNSSFSSEQEAPKAQTISAWGNAPGRDPTAKGTRAEGPLYNLKCINSRPRAHARGCALPALRASIDHSVPRDPSVDTAVSPLRVRVPLAQDPKVRSDNRTGASETRRTAIQTDSQLKRLGEVPDEGPAETCAVLESPSPSGQ